MSLKFRIKKVEYFSLYFIRSAAMTIVVIAGVTKFESRCCHFIPILTLFNEFLNSYPSPLCWFSNHFIMLFFFKIPIIYIINYFKSLKLSTELTRSCHIVSIAISRKTTLAPSVGQSFLIHDASKVLDYQARWLRIKYEATSYINFIYFIF